MSEPMELEASSSDSESSSSQPPAQSNSNQTFLDIRTLPLSKVLIPHHATFQEALSKCPKNERKTLKQESFKDNIKLIEKFVHHPGRKRGRLSGSFDDIVHTTVSYFIDVEGVEGRLFRIMLQGIVEELKNDTSVVKLAISERLRELDYTYKNQESDGIPVPATGELQYVADVRVSMQDLTQSTATITSNLFTFPRICAVFFAMSRRDASGSTSLPMEDVLERGMDFLRAQVGATEEVVEAVEAQMVGLYSKLRFLVATFLNMDIKWITHASLNDALKTKAKLEKMTKDYLKNVFDIFDPRLDDFEMRRFYPENQLALL